MSEKQIAEPWTEVFSWKCGICGKKRRDVQPVQDFEVGDACPEHYVEEPMSMTLTGNCRRRK